MFERMCLLTMGSTSLQLYPHFSQLYFHILFPYHEFVGRNHRALVDCQQTLLVMTAFEEFAKPIDSPGRPGFSGITPTQQTLDNWLVDQTLVSHHQETQNQASGWHLTEWIRCNSMEKFAQLFTRLSTCRRPSSTTHMSFSYTCCLTEGVHASSLSHVRLFYQKVVIFQFAPM